MSENIEFIAAKDLPITEAKEVNVLCVDNGELKLKEAANLGGSSGGGGYVIHVPQEDIKSQSESAVEIVLTESRDNFAEILYNGGSVWIDLSALDLPMFLAVNAFSYVDDAEGTALLLLATMLMGSITVISVTCPNGTWTPPEE